MCGTLKTSRCDVTRHHNRKAHYCCFVLFFFCPVLSTHLLIFLRHNSVTAKSQNKKKNYEKIPKKTRATCIECKPKLLQQLRSFVATEIQRKCKRLGDCTHRERREKSKLCKNPDASGPKTSRSRSRSQIRTERRGLTSVE